MSETETLPPAGDVPAAAPDGAPVLPLTDTRGADVTLPVTQDPAPPPATPEPAPKPAPKETAKASRPRRGPPPAGEVEARTTVILTT